ncbi:hypothetical protein [Novosphingobium beihaiensis]|uniref:GDT1 family protein n=1 Tax=Novosphingobium beihaiensis TaxID=2930389 RepID=A0ABT0BNF1_9SPHN|nr:hypothetical protein [Novosphingobium beihaiensis]MCJ2186568.1 hypothetical protein [Novosphingobium beihaiensis]
MPAFYLTLIAVLLAGIGARGQMTIAGLARAQGARPGVLIVALVSAVLTALLAAWAAHAVLAELPPPARMVFAAMALGLAGLESLALAPRRDDPREPTRSLGALALVLLAQQVTDAARFLIFGMGVGLAAPIASGAAGVLGGAVLAGAAWAFPQVSGMSAVRWIRRTAGGLLAIAALVLFLSQIGIL